MNEREAHRAAGGVRAPAHLIQVTLRDISQLFNSMDPSPFHERDLDHDAEEFIVGSALEQHAKLPLALEITLQQAPGVDHAEEVVAEGVRHHFAYRADVVGREFRQMLRLGRTSLLIGLLFLSACLALVKVMGRWTDVPMLLVVRESVLIVGWVAMWRPMEIFLYDLWPLLGRKRVYARLSRMPVHVKLAGETAVGPSPATG